MAMLPLLIVMVVTMMDGKTLGEWKEERNVGVFGSMIMDE